MGRSSAPVGTETRVHRGMPSTTSTIDTLVDATSVANTTVDGQSVTIGGEQQVTLLNLWATWCVPCRTEFPDLQEIHEELGPRGLRLIAVSLDQGDTDRVMGPMCET